jgi:hypothetical protein
MRSRITAKRAARLLLLLWAMPTAGLTQTAGDTEKLCVLAGMGDMRVDGQEQLQLYGTDLGFTYGLDRKIRLLFGDTWSKPATTLPELLPDVAIPRDDIYGTIDLTLFPDGDAVEAACKQHGGKAPLISFATASKMTLATLDPGVAMDGLKTPVLGFSTGTKAGAREFAMFVTGKPQACTANAQCGSFECDTGLGFVGTPSTDLGPGLTFACVDGSPGCNDNTVPSAKSSGLCRDTRSSAATPADDTSRTTSVAWRQLVGVRSLDESTLKYSTIEWLTNRFINPIAATVNDFDPSRANGLGNDYGVADGSAPATEKVFIWGRPGWTSLNSQGRTLHLYLAYLDVPRVDSKDAFDWQPRYFAGVDSAGKPRFTDDPLQAAPLDLSGGSSKPDETFDIVAHASIRWIPALNKWVMFYSGGAQTSEAICSTVSTNCKLLNRAGAAVRMRTAANPWGPWSSPQQVLAGGDPYAGPVKGSQYVAGGMLRHPDCKDPACAPHSAPPLSPSDTGAFYGANIVAEWTEARAEGVDLYWNVSTWDPYRVLLLKTRINR